MKKVFLIILATSLFLVLYVGSSSATNAIINTQMESLDQKDAINYSLYEYATSKKNSEEIDTCVHAGMVKAAYLHVKDKTNYKKWIGIEKTDCNAADMPV